MMKWPILGLILWSLRMSSLLVVTLNLLALILVLSLVSIQQTLSCLRSRIGSLRQSLLLCLISRLTNLSSSSVREFLVSKLSKFVVRSRFSDLPLVAVTFDDASLTRQEFAEEADINNIMRKYAAGLPSASAGARLPYFGDFSNVPDYQTALNQVIDAQDRFDSLPSGIRKRFDNDPAKLLSFLADDKNREEAVSLGLIDKPVETVRPVSVPEVNEGAGK